MIWYERITYSSAGNCKTWFEMYSEVVHSGCGCKESIAFRFIVGALNRWQSIAGYFTAQRRHSKSFLLDPLCLKIDEDSISDDDFISDSVK